MDSDHAPEYPQRLGDFEIIRELGRGGMGVVYQAIDAKLERHVAIKIIPDSLSGDRDRQERFKLEAKVLASLNHPCIAGIYSLNEAEGVHFLVLELVEGETLQERLANGPLPIDEALDVCRQIAEAVEAAHGAGVIHRDLKPGNVKIAPDGKVKVLDFGLAKCFENNVPAGDPALSPTVTREGVLLGTAAYMSPEQARGKPVDKRTDVWAFGCVLFESLTGKLPFSGDSVSDTLAAVLKQEPDLKIVPAETPDSILRLLRRTLAKDASRRLRDMGDARLEIEEALSNARHPTTSTSNLVRSPRSPWSRPAVAWSTAGVMALVALVSLAFLSFGENSGHDYSLQDAVAALRKMQERPPVPGPYVITEPTLLGRPAVTVSPDGRQIVYVVNQQGQRQLYLRDLAESFEASPVRKTEDGRNPFFSPDGSKVAFLTRKELKVITLATNRVVTLCKTLPVARGGCWVDEHTILFSPSPVRGIVQIDADKESNDPWDAPGVTTRVTQPDRDKYEYGHFQPSMLPDGESFLFTIVTWLDDDPERIAMYNMKTKEIRHVISGGMGGRFDSESQCLLYARDDQLFADRFDPGTGQREDREVRIAGDVSAILTAEYSIGQNTLAYIPGIGARRRRLVWVDSDGTSTPLAGLPEFHYSSVRLAPDEKKLAAEFLSNNLQNDVRWLELDRGIFYRLGDTPLFDGGPVWHPAGQSLVYSRQRFRSNAQDPNPPQLALSPIDGTVDEVLFFHEPNDPQFQMNAQFATSWSHDGEHLAFTDEHTDTNFDIWIMDVNKRESFPLFSPTEADEAGAVFSPDDKWVAYQSNEYGRYEAFVCPFPTAGARGRQVSLGGGIEPQWARGNERLRLYYRQGQSMMFVESLVDADFRPGNPQVLFTRDESARTLATERMRASYDVSSDGRFLMIEQDPKETTTHINVLFNWA